MCPALRFSSGPFSNSSASGVSTSRTPFNTYGQDGLVREYEDGSYEILNDETVEALCRQGFRPPGLVV